MRDDVVGAMKWIEAAGLAPQPCNDYVFIVEEAMEFHPGNDERPFKGDNAMGRGIVYFYEERRRIKEANAYDIAELNIKLSLNSLSGKFGQKIGGSGFEAPPTAYPWYYAAITATCRRRVLEAVLTEPGAVLDPELVVGFMTDGGVTTRPLEKLERVKGEGDRKELGDWEAKTIVGGMYLQSGYYTHIDADSRETITKLRGARKAFIVGAGDQAELHDMLLDKVLPEWQKPRDPANFLKRDTDWPAIDIEQKTYITPGTAVASKERWKIGGRWAVLKRRSNIHMIGTKRILDQSQPWLYWSCNGMPPESLEGIPDKILRNWRAWCEQYGLEAVRCRKRVPSLPARNTTPDIPSEPAWPKWMAGGDDANDGEGKEGKAKEEGEDRLDDLREQADIAEGI